MTTIAAMAASGLLLDWLEPSPSLLLSTSRRAPQPRRTPPEPCLSLPSTVASIPSSPSPPSVSGAGALLPLLLLDGKEPSGRMRLFFLVTPVAGVSPEVAGGAGTASGTAPLPLLHRASMEKEEATPPAVQWSPGPHLSASEALTRSGPRG